MRCEPNISVRTPEQKARGEYGTKVEVKNLNSFRSVRAAIDYELQRQIDLIESGGQVEQVNMGWDETHQRTVLQRSKEKFRGLSLLPRTGFAAAGRGQPGSRDRATLPELPEARRDRDIEESGLRPLRPIPSSARFWWPASSRKPSPPTAVRRTSLSASPPGSRASCSA